MIGKYFINSGTLRGKLTASNNKAVSSEEDRRALFRALVDRKLRRIASLDSKWYDSTLHIDHTSGIRGSREAGLDLIKSLGEVFKSEAVATFGFNGELTLVVEQEEAPIVFRITVKDGVLSYQEAEYSWKNEVTL